MERHLHNIEGLFKEGLEDHEEAPSESVWNNLENKLDKQKAFLMERKYASAKRIALVLFFLLMSLVIFEVKKAETGAAPEQGKMVADNSTSSNNRQANTVAPEGSATPENSPEDNNLIKSDLPPADDFSGKAPDASSSEPDMFNSFNRQKRSSGARADVNISSPGATEDAGDAPTDATDNSPLSYAPYFPQVIGHAKQDAELADRKIKLLSIPSLFAAIPAGAASAKGRNNKKHGLFVSPFFSPRMAWYKLQDDDANDPGSQYEAAEVEKREQREFSFAAGLYLGFHLNDKWSLQTGLIYNNTNISLRPTLLYAQRDESGDVKYRINSSSGYGYVLPAFSSHPAVGDSLYSFTTVHILDYLEVPLMAERSVHLKKWDFTLTAGPSVNFLVSGRIETTLKKGFREEDEVVNRLYGLKKVHLTGGVTAGAEYRLNNRFSLRVAPALKFSLNSINQNIGIKSYPNSFGLNAGVKINL